LQGDCTEAHLATLSRRLQACSFAFGRVFVVLELPDALLLPLLRASSRLHGQARALGVGLQLLPCQSVEATQVRGHVPLVRRLTICCHAAPDPPAPWGRTGLRLRTCWHT
jgi:hypothetical protein